MTLGDLLEEAALRNLCARDRKKKDACSYTEFVREGQYTIRLQSLVDKNAFIESQLPTAGTEAEINYLRMFFLSEVFNAAMYGQQKKKFKK